MGSVANLVMRKNSTLTDEDMSLLRYSIFASRRDLNVLRGVVDGMVRADPRLRREAENVRAPIRVATRIQRAWRARRRKGDVPASSP